MTVKVLKHESKHNENQAIFVPTNEICYVPSMLSYELWTANPTHVPLSLSISLLLEKEFWTSQPPRVNTNVGTNSRSLSTSIPPGRCRSAFKAIPAGRSQNCPDTQCRIKRFSNLHFDLLSNKYCLLILNFYWHIFEIQVDGNSIKVSFCI